MRHIQRAWRLGDDNLHPVHLPGIIDRGRLTSYRRQSQPAVLQHPFRIVPHRPTHIQPIPGLRADPAPACEDGVNKASAKMIELEISDFAD